jgi:HK97 family phage prohead protease
MPYLISDKQSDCQGWATVKEESDGSYTTIGCHDNKQDAIDQMVAVSIEEGIEPGGEVSKRALPDNYRPALSEDVPEGRACGNCYFYNEAKQNDAGNKAWCELWEDFVDGAYYCNKWKADSENRQVDLTVPAFIRANAERGLKLVREGFGGDGLTDTAKREAREMAAGRITENKVRKMAPWFARHKVDGQAPKNKDSSHPEYPGAGLVAWLIWGGDSNFSDRAQNWAQRKIDALDAEADSRSKMAKKIERRTYSVRDVEARADGDGMRLAGYAAVFNDASVPLPFKESIAPGAFRKTLSETPDVRMLINHEGLPVARTKNGTLKLEEDDRGLRFEADLADTQEGRDIYELVKRGDVDQMSFAFRVIRQKWNDDRSRRVLTEVSLADGDVSVVTYPAYPTTTVEAREHIKQAMKALKEGRQIDDATMMVLQTVFDDMSEGHEYIMKALGVFETLMNDRVYDEDEVDDDENEDSSRAVDVVGDFVEWDSSGGTARGRIVRVAREGSINVPDSDFTITAEEGDPAVLIRVYRELRDGYVATETLVGHKASELRAIDPLPEPSEEAGRKISLRLAQAIINSTK